MSFQPQFCWRCGKPATHIQYTRKVYYQVPLRDNEEAFAEERELDADDWNDQSPVCDEHADTEEA